MNIDKAIYVEGSVGRYTGFKQVMKMPRFNVSVIVVNYNCYSTLDDCISSILHSNEVGELILVDNASTDGSLNLIKKQVDARLKIFRLNQNIGLAGARNLAAAKTRSKYIAFVDADSKVDPQWLEIPCFLLEKYVEIGAVMCNVLSSKHPEGIPLYCACSLLDGCHWTSIPKQKHVCSWHWLFPIGAGFVVRRDAWNIVEGFDPAFFVGNDDVDFGVRLWLSGYEMIMSSEGTVYHEGGNLRSQKDISPIFLFYDSIYGYLRLWAKNLEGRTLLKNVLPFSLLYPFTAFCRGRVVGLKGLIFFLKSFPSILNERHRVQQLRKIPDKKIIPLMFGAGMMPIQLLTGEFRWFYKGILRRIRALTQSFR